MQDMRKVLGLGLMLYSAGLVSANPAQQDSVDRWYQGGRLVEVSAGLQGQTRKLWVRKEGTGPTITFIHGYPTSSYDWAAVSSLLSSHCTVLTFDLLGFGRSEKPRKHNYTTMEQASLLQNLWKTLGITESVVVGHDIGAMVAEEVLARERDASGPRVVRGLVILNSSPYLESYQPLLINQLISTPLIGNIVGALVNETSYSESMKKLFSTGHPVSTSTLSAYWRLFSSDDGTKNLFGLVQWLPEKYRINARLEKVLSDPRVPLRFVWGMNDPASGPAQARLVLGRHPGRVAPLEGIGHFPQIEVPEVVAEEIRRLMAQVE